MRSHVRIYDRINYAKHCELVSTVTLSEMTEDDFLGVPFSNKCKLRLEHGQENTFIIMYVL